MTYEAIIFSKNTVKTYNAYNGQRRVIVSATGSTPEKAQKRVLNFIRNNHQLAEADFCVVSEDIVGGKEINKFYFN